MNDTHTASVAMMIRNPVAEVFEAFVDPAITSKFWFTEGSARLDAGVPVRWTWAMYGHTAEATVDELVPNERIVVTWGGPDTPTEVTWTFKDRGDGTTFARIENSGLADEAEVVASTEGFSFVMAGAKAWLEHGLELGLVRDRFPDGLGIA